MRLSLRTKLLAANIVLVAVVVGLVLVQLSQSLGRDLRSQLNARLEAQARGAALWIGEGRHPGKLASRLGAVVGAYITIFDRDGDVVGESDARAPQPWERPDEHRQPEVIAAREGHTGTASRPFAQGGEEMLYVAVPAADGLIVRLALPLSSVNHTVRAMHERLALAGVLALGVALALAFFSARLLTGPVRAMTMQAERLAAGDYEGHTPSAAPDELGTLSRALSRLAADLKAKIHDLTAERDRLTAILAGMEEGVLVLGPDGHVLLANPAASRVLNGEGTLEGKALGEVIREPKLREVVEAAAVSRRMQEAEVDVPTGGRSIALYVRPLDSEAGAGLVTVLRDMTRVRRLLSQRRDFVADVSHELRTPVAAIQGYAETLLGGAKDPAVARQFLETIHRHAARLGALVESLLHFSELEVRSPEEAVRVPMPVATIAGNVASTLESAAERDGVRIEVEVPAGLEAVGDPAGLEEVLENLVSNALKYGATGRVVRIRGKRDGARVELAVQDEGEGIGPEHLPRLFERFYRVDPSRSRDRGGAGLGLAIVKQLVEGMGGTVDVESALGQGTTFRVRLPLPRVP